MPSSARNCMALSFYRKTAFIFSQKLHRQGIFKKMFLRPLHIESQMETKG